VRAVYNLITEISPDLSTEHKNYLFERLVQSEEWDEKLVNTLKEFSASMTLAYSARSGAVSEENLYALPYFYEHVTGSGVTPTVIELELPALCELLRSPSYARQR
jgi:hypothetical protein